MIKKFIFTILVFSFIFIAESMEAPSTLKPINSLQDKVTNQVANLAIEIYDKKDFESMQEYLLKSLSHDVIYGYVYPKILSFNRPDILINELLRRFKNNENYFELFDKFDSSFQAKIIGNLGAAMMAESNYNALNVIQGDILPFKFTKAILDKNNNPEFYGMLMNYLTRFKSLLENRSLGTIEYKLVPDIEQNVVINYDIAGPKLNLRIFVKNEADFNEIRSSNRFASDILKTIKDSKMKSLTALIELLKVRLRSLLEEEYNSTVSKLEFSSEAKTIADDIMKSFKASNRSAINDISKEDFQEGIDYIFMVYLKDNLRNLYIGSLVSFLFGDDKEAVKKVLEKLTHSLPKLFVEVANSDNFYNLHPTSELIYYLEHIIQDKRFLQPRKFLLE